MSKVVLNSKDEMDIKRFQPICLFLGRSGKGKQLSKQLSKQFLFCLPLPPLIEFLLFIISSSPTPYIFSSLIADYTGCQATQVYTSIPLSEKHSNYCNHLIPERKYINHKSRIWCRCICCIGCNGLLPEHTIWIPSKILRKIIKTSWPETAQYTNR